VIDKNITKEKTITTTKEKTEIKTPLNSKKIETIEEKIVKNPEIIKDKVVKEEIEVKSTDKKSEKPKPKKIVTKQIKETQTKEIITKEEKKTEDELWDDGMKIPDWLKTDEDK
jgi:hypothetical protein